MTESQQAAKFYLRYWYKNSEGKWSLADNAPTNLWVCVKTTLDGIPHNFLHEVFEAILANKGVPMPDFQTILNWAARNPDSTMVTMDALLANPKKAKTWTARKLLEDVYRSEFIEVSDAVHRFLLSTPTK